MTLEQLSRDEETIVRQYEYDDGSMVAVDFGAADADVAADVVDDTVIVVSDGDQYEFELPTETTDAHTFIKNGVLTIQMEADR